VVELVHGRWLVSMRGAWVKRMSVASSAGNDETNVVNVLRRSGVEELMRHMTGVMSHFLKGHSRDSWQKAHMT